MLNNAKCDAMRNRKAKKKNAAREGVRAGKFLILYADAVTVLLRR
jgi:hypothetical protein